MTIRISNLPEAVGFSLIVLVALLVTVIVIYSMAQGISMVKALPGADKAYKALDPTRPVTLVIVSVLASVGLLTMVYVYTTIRGETR